MTDPGLPTTEARTERPFVGTDELRMTADSYCRGLPEHHARLYALADDVDDLRARVAGLVTERQEHQKRIEALVESLESETWEGPQNLSERGYNAGLLHAAELLAAVLSDDGSEKT